MNFDDEGYPVIPTWAEIAKSGKENVSDEDEFRIVEDESENTGVTQDPKATINGKTITPAEYAPKGFTHPSEKMRLADDKGRVRLASDDFGKNWYTTNSLIQIPPQMKSIVYDNKDGSMGSMEANGNVLTTHGKLDGEGLGQYLGGHLADIIRMNSSNPRDMFGFNTGARATQVLDRTLERKWPEALHYPEKVLFDEFGGDRRKFLDAVARRAIGFDPDLLEEEGEKWSDFMIGNSSPNWPGNGGDTYPHKDNTTWDGWQYLNWQSPMGQRLMDTYFFPLLHKAYMGRHDELHHADVTLDTPHDKWRELMNRNIANQDAYDKEVEGRDKEMEAWAGPGWNTLAGERRLYIPREDVLAMYLAGTLRRLRDGDV